MKLVGSRLRDYIHLSTGIATKRSIVTTRGHLEFSNGINRWSYGKRVGFRIDVVDTIKQEVIRVFACAINAEGEITAHRAGGALGRGHCTRNKQTKFVKVPPIQRQVFDGSILD